MIFCKKHIKTWDFWGAYMCLPQHFQTKSDASLFAAHVPPSRARPPHLALVAPLQRPAARCRSCVLRHRSGVGKRLGGGPGAPGGAESAEVIQVQGLQGESGGVGVSSWAASAFWARWPRR